MRQENDEEYSINRKNPNLDVGNYITAAKVAQCTAVSDNRRKNNRKNETAKKIAAHNICIQQKLSEDFQQC